MIQKTAAGLLMCRFTLETPEYFLVHPGGPFFQNKDEGFWTIPKGLPEAGEELLQTAQREFQEETGIKPRPPFHSLGTIQQKGGKIVHAWTFLGDWQPESGIRCNTFELEWPPRSGKRVEFPEVDRAQWMSYDLARSKLLQAQLPLLERAKSIYENKNASP